MMFKFLESALNLDLFYTPLPSQISFKFLSLRRVILLIPLRSHFFENIFPPAGERSGGNYDLLCQNSIRKFEDDSEH